ncbi:uncharacterized protein N7506_002441 [Penicillium brevicompactum]|uniref:uncharacterized protein n=1 Tax=Penicillium brevicompactum TaxID=5074 RepID=UPI00254124AE|nr:uncharacterized protein N7506_002441 [Penicillium brevicompactum]KAJ5344076.1 hypothetical protein N7506_002441 [Penicillium brevicompactum]
MAVLPRLSKEKLDQQHKLYAEKPNNEVGIILVSVVVFVVIAIAVAYLLYFRIKNNKAKVLVKMKSWKAAYRAWKLARKSKEVSEKPDLEKGLAVTNTVTAPKTAHVANARAEGPDVDSITANLTEAYLKKTTAVMHPIA